MNAVDRHLTDSPFVLDFMKNVRTIQYTGWSINTGKAYMSVPWQRATTRENLLACTIWLSWKIGIYAFVLGMLLHTAE